MVTALRPFQYGRVLGLFEPLDYNLAIQAIATGRAPGQVYADYIDQPSVGLIWDGKAILFLSGDPEGGLDSGLDVAVAEEILPEAVERGYARWLRVVCPPAWKDSLAATLGASSLQARRRQHFSLRGLTPGGRKAVPKGYRLTPVDPELFAGAEVDRLDDLATEICGTWGSLETFFEWGFGYCLVKGDPGRVVSWCLSEYNGPGQCELGVETVEDEQRRGLATIVTAACRDRAVRTGITPSWHCWPGNEGSMALARRVGLVEDLTYRVYLPEWPE